MEIQFGLPYWLTEFVAQNPTWLLTLSAVLVGSVLLYILTRWQEFVALAVGAALYMVPFVHLS